MRPLFVTFEGLDGSGKSTHLRSAVRWLETRGRSCCVTQEPGGTPLGEEIRSVFLDRKWGALDGTVEMLLLFASRRQHLLEVIDPALEQGRDVICDRFTDSTLAYQGYGRGVPVETIEAIDRLATGGRRPDHTLLLDLPAEAAWRRGQSKKRRESPGGVDRLDAESQEFYQRVREGFLALAEREPERISVVKSGGSRQQTWRQVEACLERLYPQLEEVAG